jgi:hypothetical protein
VTAAPAHVEGRTWHDWGLKLQEIYERWIAKFEKPRLKALSDLKRRLEKAND